VPTTSEKPKTSKTPVLDLRLTPKHEAALEEYIQRQKAKPDRQAVGLAALEMLFEQAGLWSSDSD
jgi:hypothetical protein